jgi:hypothetical protein
MPLMTPDSSQTASAYGESKTTDLPELIIAMTTISLCILNNLHICLHGPMSYSSWESACPSATRVGVQLPVLFEN